jgi:hypothetical protein
MDRKLSKRYLHRIDSQRFNVETVCHAAYVHAIIEFLPCTGQHDHAYGFDGSSNTLS